MSPPPEPRARNRQDVVSERRLIRAARRGSPEARERVVASQLGLVRAIARRYRDLGLPLDDLVQEGSLGILEAIDGHDPRRGDFGTYARLRVRRAIQNALTDQSRMVRLPKQVVERRRTLAQADERLTQMSNGHRPTVAELAAATGLSRTTVEQSRAALSVGSLEEALTDISAPDPAISMLECERAKDLRAAVAQLKGRRRSVVRRRFGLGRPEQSLGDIAAELHVSPQRARALEQEALAALRASLERAGLEP
jgi:RNA polymerase sigma factor (sigma-70 family)